MPSIKNFTRTIGLHWEYFLPSIASPPSLPSFYNPTLSPSLPFFLPLVSGPNLALLSTYFWLWAWGLFPVGLWDLYEGLGFEARLYAYKENALPAVLWLMPHCPYILPALTTVFLSHNCLLILSMTPQVKRVFILEDTVWEYEIWKSSLMFFLGRQLVIGRDYKSFLLLRISFKI